MIKIFGYIRVSTKEQNIERQLKPLLALGIEERDIYIDKITGKTFDRPKYKALKEILREGDILYIKSLDRLGRNKALLLKEWESITKDIKAHIIVLDMPLLDTTKFKDLTGLESLITDIFLQILSFFAEEERRYSKERQREGIEIAKSKNIKFGKPVLPVPVDFPVVAQKVLNKEITAVSAMQELNMKKGTFYKHLKIFNNRNL